MASATLTAGVSNQVFTLTPSNVTPASSVTVSGTGSSTQVSLTPQTTTDTTFSLTFVPGTGITSLNSVSTPIPFGISQTQLFAQGDGSILVICFNVAPFQGLSFGFNVGYTPAGSTVPAFEDPTITFNPPSTITEAQLDEAPVAAEPVMV